MDEQPKKKRVKDMTPEEKKAHQAELRAKRKAWLQEYKNEWKTKVLEYFTYLETDYRFRLTKIPFLGPWYISVRFESQTLAVEVRRSVEFNAVELWLIRLVNRKVPNYPISLFKDTPIYWYMFDGVIERRAPTEEVETFDNLRGLSDERIEQTLNFLAHALREYADDVLHGDFSILDEIANDFHQKARERPKERTIWLSPFLSDEVFTEISERGMNAPPGQRVIYKRMTEKQWNRRMLDDWADYLLPPEEEGNSSESE